VAQTSKDKSIAGCSAPFAMLCCVPLVILTLWATFQAPPFHDFICYWGAARVFLGRHNPYTSILLANTEHAAGWLYADPMMMLCPPWALPVFAPAGLLPFRHAQSLWRDVSLILDLVSGLALWHYFGGARRCYWIAVATVLTLVPVGTAELMGQPTPLILASFVAFLFLVRAEAWFLAGCSLFLVVGLKPHLLWLVAAAAFLWAVQEGRWRLLAGLAFVFAIACIAVVAYDPAAFHYFGATYPVMIGAECGFGGSLRLAFGLSRTWLQYIPTLCGALWFGCYWIRYRRVWDWARHLPLLLVVSLASAPYYWFHDFLLAVPAFIAVAARGAYRSRFVLIAWLGVQVLILLPEIKAVESAMSALWIPFLLFAQAQIRAVSRANGDHEDDRTASRLFGLTHLPRFLSTLWRSPEKSSGAFQNAKL
jgi:hypothetical protein